MQLLGKENLRTVLKCWSMRPRVLHRVWELNAMDRLADGLGVELSTEMRRLVEKNASLGNEHM